MRRYSKTVMNRAGVPEDTAKCIAAVWQKLDRTYHQCTRKRGHGQDGDFCKQHGRMGRSVYIPKDE